MTMIDKGTGLFRKKPIVIEAWQYRPALWGDAPEWLLDVERVWGAPHAGEVHRSGEELQICTLEGQVAAHAGDWIIKGVQGELYPCKPEIFAATYEAVATPSEPTDTARVDWPISTDGPHAITDARRWLARQLMDSRLSEAEAFGIVAHSPAIDAEMEKGR